jgi:hypothetical protein
MNKKVEILLVSMMVMALLTGCAGLKIAPTKVLPVTVEVTSVERLNAIAAKPPFQATDVLVFRVNFKLTNPNDALVKVDDLYFEAKVEDGTPDKTIIQATSTSGYLIPAGGEIVWSSTEPFLYGGVRASYLLRGVGGEGGMQGVFKKMEELWIDLGADQRKFLIDGNITSSLPDFTNVEIIRKQFKTEFAIPKL